MFDDKLLLEKERLEFGFELNRAELTAGDWRINEEIFKIDAADETIERAKLSESEQRHFLNAGLTAESKLRRGRQSLIIQLQNIRSLSDKAIYEYVDRLIETLDANLLERLREFPTSFAERVKKLIDERLLEHRRKKFFELLGEGRIKCEPRYKMPSTITPSKNIKIARSLYEAEEEMNEPETRLVYELTAASASFSSPFTSRTAVFGASFISSLRALVVRPLEMDSNSLPTVIRVRIMAADSK